VQIADIKFHGNTPSGYRSASSGQDGQIKRDDKANSCFSHWFSNAPKQKEQWGTK